MMRLLAVLLLAVTLPLFGDVPQWPRFRGPNGVGVDATASSVQHRVATSPLWKTPIDGVGNGSPIVWGDRLYLMTATAAGDQRFLLCLNVADGKEVWRCPMPGVKSPHHPRNSLASGTPATDGERVYVVNWDGREQQLVAVDLTGKIAWRHSLGRFTSHHGAGHSPVVHQGVVYVAHDSDFRAHVVAVQANTGKVQWQATREPHKACYSTPCVLERAGQPPLLAVVSSANVAAYDLSSGALRWTVAWKWAKSPLRTVSSPLVAGNLLIAASGDGGGDRLMMAVGLDREPPAPIWELRRGIPYVPMMVSHGEHLYYLNDQGVAGCLNAATGATVWTQRLGGNVSASLIGLGQTLVGANEEGDVFLFAATAKYEALGKLSLGEGVIASPAAAGGRLYLRGKQHLFCFAVE